MGTGTNQMKQECLQLFLLSRAHIQLQNTKSFLLQNTNSVTEKKSWSHRYFSLAYL